MALVLAGEEFAEPGVERRFLTGGVEMGVAQVPCHSTMGDMFTNHD